MRLKFRPIRLVAVGLLLYSASSVTFAHEAPVVDAQQQQAMDDSAAATQPVVSTGSQWQPVTTTNNVSSNAATNNTAKNTTQQNPSEQNGWQTVSAQPSNPQPAASTQSATPAASSNAPVDQRVQRLEQQVSNYSQMNLPQQVSNLQQQNAALQGQLEVAQHNLQQLTDQQKTYYQDLQQQIAQLQKNKLAQANDNNKNDKKSTAFTKKKDIPTEVADNTEKSTQKKLAQADQDETKTNDASNADDQNNQSGSLNQKHLPSMSDADSYEKAFHSLSNKHFKTAETAFQQYLTDYPKGQFAVSAHFWLGEIALMNQQYKVANKQFKIVVNDYPTSTKVPDAELKIAMIHAATGKTTEAKKEFAQIRKSYPGTTAAQLASIRLQQLANATSVT